MSKEPTLNQLEEYIGDAVHDCVAHAFDEKVRDTSFKTMRDYAPYGDTEVEVCQYVSDEDDEKFREEYEKELDFDTVVGMLKEDDYFKETIMDLVKHVVWNRTLDV